MKHWEDIGANSLQRVADTLKSYVQKWIPVSLQITDMAVAPVIDMKDWGEVMYDKTPK